MPPRQYRRRAISVQAIVIPFVVANRQNHTSLKSLNYLSRSDSEQICRGRSWQAEAADPPGARLQDAEDGIRHDQGVRGDAGIAQGAGFGLQPHPRHLRRGAHCRTRLRSRLTGHGRSVPTCRRPPQTQPGLKRLLFQKKRRTTASAFTVCNRTLSSGSEPLTRRHHLVPIRRDSIISAVTASI
jgi:hypothetical protein